MKLNDSRAKYREFAVQRDYDAKIKILYEEQTAWDVITKIKIIFSYNDEIYLYKYHDDITCMSGSHFETVEKYEGDKFFGSECRNPFVSRIWDKEAYLAGCVNLYLKTGNSCVAARVS